MIEFEFVGFNGGHGLFEGETTTGEGVSVLVGVRCAESVADLLEVFNGTEGTGNGLEALCAGLEFFGELSAQGDA